MTDNEYLRNTMTRMNRRAMLKRSAIAGGGLLASSTFLAACGSDSDSADSVAADMSFQLGWLRLVQFGGHFMGQEMGYFDEENVNAEFKSGGPGIDPVADVTSGAVLLGDAEVGRILLAREAGAPLVAIGTIFNRSPFAFISFADDPITSLPDMVGKTIGVHDRYLQQFEGMLGAQGIEPSDIDIVPDTGDPALLVNGGATAFMGFSTSQGVALQKQGLDVVFAHVGDLGDPAYSNVLFTTEDNLANRKDELVRWLRADQRGHQYAVDNPEEMAEIVQGLYGEENGQTIEEATGSAVAQVDLIKGHPNGLLWIDEAVFEEIGQFLVDAGTLESLSVVDGSMTTEILEAI